MRPKQLIQVVGRRFEAPVADALLVMTAGVFSAAFLVVAVARVLYPFDLDFIEDGMLLQALRFASREPVFVPPNAEFVPHVYMPLYTWLGGLLLQVSGVGFAPLRLLSLVAALSSAALIFGVTRRQGAGWALAVVCASLFLAGDRIAGGWYALARVDSLFVALTLGGVALAVYGSRRVTGLLGAAILLALAFMTKQQGLLFVIVVGLYLLAIVGRRAWIFWAAFVLLAGMPVLLAQRASDGWFGAYVFDIAFAAPLEWRRAGFALGAEFMGSAGVLTTAFIALLLAWLWTMRGDLRSSQEPEPARRLSRLRQRAVGQPWLLFAGLAMLISLAGRASVGGDRNNLILGYAFLCLMPALLVTQRRRSGPDGPLQQCEVWQGRSRRVLPWLLVLQFGLTVVNPVYLALGYRQAGQLWPDAANRSSGERLVTRISAFPGDVWVMMHPFYAVLAGKPVVVQVQPLWHARWRGQEPLPADLVQRIVERQFAAIISDESQYFETEPALQQLIETYYVRSEHMDQSEAPTTFSGMIVRPKTIYVPRP